MEFIIQNYHFTKCTNNKCKAYYLLNLDDIKKESQLFCPRCKDVMLHSHLVQCENCQTVLNFIPALSNEETVIFYVGKCSACSGTIIDEKHLIPHYFPESFI